MEVNIVLVPVLQQSGSEVLHQPTDMGAAQRACVCIIQGKSLHTIVGQINTTEQKKNDCEHCPPNIRDNYTLWAVAYWFVGFSLMLFLTPMMVKNETVNVNTFPYPFRMSRSSLDLRAC
jgi:hypothetical protein